MDTLALTTDTSGINSIFCNGIFTIIVIPLVMLFLGWVAKGFYDKYFLMKPRLYLKLGKPLYSQRTKGFEYGYELTWTFECTLKNNSQYNSYNIEIFEKKPLNSKDKIINNRYDVETKLNEINHTLLANQSLTFDISKTIHYDTDEFIHSRIDENGAKIYMPSLKHHNPQIALMPKILNRTKIYIKYENEKGRKYYLKHQRVNEKEKNEVLGFYLLNKMKLIK